MKMSNIIRVIVSIITFALFVWVNLNYFTAGTVIGSVLFGGAFVICIVWKPFSRFIKRVWRKTSGKIALSAVCAVGVAGIVCCTVFSVNMTRSVERSVDAPGAVIVLGCQVRGETPSTMLAKRCDAALETLSEYPNAVCVVSGGKGNGENISEAEAMRRYLVERGIPESRIIAEDRSTSTRENIRLSAELLRERGIDRAVIVTNEFHQYRADIYARNSGLTVGHHSAKTPLYNLANYWVREWAALLSAVILG